MRSRLESGRLAFIRVEQPRTLLSSSVHIRSGFGNRAALKKKLCQRCRIPYNLREADTLTT